jgi:hypothetical protein
MTSQTISRPSPQTDEPNTEALDAQRNGSDIAARREARRARSISRGRSTDSRTAPLQTPSSAGRPHGHVVGHPVAKARPVPTRATYQKAA